MMLLRGGVSLQQQQLKQPTQPTQVQGRYRRGGIPGVLRTRIPTEQACFYFDAAATATLVGGAARTRERASSEKKHARLDQT